MSASSLWLGVLGGALIGASASLLLLGNGRVAGISGIVAGFLTPAETDERSWRGSFLLGLLLGGLVLLFTRPQSFVDSPRALPVLAVAGLLVGFGTRMGGGCTSGHGVCGLSRGSKRSVVATLLFMATAMLTVLVTRLVGSP